LAVVRVQALNIYAGPAAAYDILRQATEGEELEILAQAKGGEWFLVRLGGGRLGWVWAPLLLVEEDVAGVPPAATVPPTPPP
jgi:uncharacterized protein YgiM (DUF1202 family)